MQTITHKELDALCKNGEPIASKAGYPAVVLHPDGTVTKIWARKKGFFSSTTIRPYSTRFIKNAAELTRRGIVAPEILDHAQLENSHVRIVTYRALAGKNIRELLENEPGQVNTLSLAKYIYLLHEKGIQFGGMHLGNIIQRSNNQGYGLIDFTDVTFYSKPLNIKRRVHNLSVPLRYTQDIDRIKMAGLPDLLETYGDLLELNDQEKQQFFTQVKSRQK